MTVIKLDVDYKMSKQLLKEFIETRLGLLALMNYHIVDYNYAKTKHGYHLWFKVIEQLSEQRLAEIQFLLGDDIRRARFNFMRAKMNVFNEFNILFSFKKSKKLLTK